MLDAPTTRKSLIEALVQMGPGSGSEDAEQQWSEFLAEYRQPFTRYVRQLLRNAGDKSLQDELVTDLIYRIYMSISSFRFEFVSEHHADRPGRFRRWVSGIARNCVNDWKRAAARRAKHEVNGISDLTADDSGFTEVEDFLEKRLLLRAAMQRVQTRVHRQHWELFYRAILEEEDRASLAERANISATNLRVILVRIKSQIRKEVERIQAE